MIIRTSNTRSIYRRGGSSRPQRSNYRWGGGGVFSNLIGRKLISKQNVKNLINTISKSKITQKVTNAAVDGASKALQERVHESIAAAARKPNKKKEKKNRLQETINSIIDDLSIPKSSEGKGIVYD